MNVNEGKKFNFGNVSVSSELKKLDPDKIKNALPFSSGNVYNASTIKESIQDIKSLAELNGYSFIKIEPVLKKDELNNQIDVELVLDEGPRVYVNKIDIVGNTRTIDKVIRENFLFLKVMHIINLQLIILKTR